MPETLVHPDVGRITLYKIPNLLEENNFIVENATNFLNAYIATGRMGQYQIQYQRLENSKRVKLSLDQDEAIYRYSNYCTIERGAWWNGAPRPEYRYYMIGLYFIVGWHQLAPNTVELELKLDVLNTFFPMFKDHFTKSSYIARAHRDRFTVANKSTLANTLDLCANFDRVSENDSPKLVRKTSQSTRVYDSRGGDSQGNPLKFYLVYRSGDDEGDTRPCVDLAASRELMIAAGMQGPSYVMNVSDMVTGRYYYILGDIAFDVVLQTVDGAITRTIHLSGNGTLTFKKIATSIASIPFMVVLSFLSDLDIFSTDENGKYMDSSWYQTAVIAGPITITKGQTLYYSQDFTTDSDIIRQMENVPINAGMVSPKYLGEISQLDRTDSRILKVVECPYCPINYSFNSQTGIYSFDTAKFPSESKENPPFLRTYNLAAGFGEQTINDLNISWMICKNYDFDDFDDLRNAFLEDPKLLTTPYFSITFVYDSFSAAIKLEDYDKNASIGTATAARFAIVYKQSSNISSDLAFLIEPIKTYPVNYNYYLRFADEDYPQLIVASRNNEIPLFSSSYLDYIRNGYNYDKKKAADAAGFSYSMAGLQIAASILSFAASSVTGGVSAAAGISLAAGGISSLAGAGHNALKADEDIAQKINELKAQSFKVANIDNLDLFNFYGGNKLQIHYYGLEQHTKNEIAARFQLFGYAVGEYGNPVDWLYSRKFFNFIKCDPVFDDGYIDSISPFIEEISDRLRAGATLFHPDGYDLDRWKENLEISIINELPTEE